jgi:hypothetical protein
MATTYPNIFHCKTLQNLPQLGIFWFENLPSGNPAQNRRKKHPIQAGFLIAEPQQQAVG